MATVTKRVYPNGSFRYVLDYYDTDGRRRRDTLPEGTTKKKAREALRDIEARVSKGLYVHDAGIKTFKEIAADWIQLKRANVRASTWKVLEGHTRNHFSDFDHLKINRINTPRVEKWISDRQADGMNLFTLRKIITTLGQIFSYAVRHGYIGYNPLQAAQRPRAQGHEKKPIRILSGDEIKALLNATKQQKYRMLFTLAIMSGARQGELLGLKWPDVDWDSGQIHIQRTYNNGGWYDVKTTKSNRRVDIGPATMLELKRWKVACPPSRLKLVFPNEAGGPINATNLRNRYFGPALEKAAEALKDPAIKKTRFHDLRHTCASILLDQGQTIKYIQKQLGHASPTITLNVYSHLMKDSDPDAAAALEKIIF